MLPAGKNASSIAYIPSTGSISTSIPASRVRTSCSRSIMCRSVSRSVTSRVVSLDMVTCRSVHVVG